jgi:hypothetical protein
LTLIVRTSLAFTRAPFAAKSNRHGMEARL